MRDGFKGVALAAAVVLGVGLAAAPAHAQSGGKQDYGIGFGVKGGLLFSSLDFGENDDFLKNKTGFTGGLFIGGNRGGVLGVELDLLYAEKGAKTRSNDEDFEIKVLQVPILLRLNAGTHSRAGINVYGLVGPAIDFRLDTKFRGIDIVDSTEGYDVNLVFGGGIEITRFLAEVRYNHGLRNISKNVSGSDEIKTRSVAALIGVRFN